MIYFHSERMKNTQGDMHTFARSVTRNAMWVKQLLNVNVVVSYQLISFADMDVERNGN